MQLTLRSEMQVLIVDGICYGLARAIESLKAAELRLQNGLVNSAASWAYYAMVLAAQIALEAEGLARPEIRARRAASG